MEIRLAEKYDRVIFLGKSGENNARMIRFDVSDWIGEFGGEGTAALLHRRAGDDQPYPARLERNGGAAEWLISSADVEKAGKGQAELQYIVGDVVVKSRTYETITDQSLGEGGEVPPDPARPWVEEVLQTAEEVKRTVVNTPFIGEKTGTWFVWDGVKREYIDTGVKAQGTPGYSPTVFQEAIDGGHRLTITTADKVTVLDIMDGEDGDPGDPGVGIASVKQTVVSDADGGENEITVTLTNGKKETFVVRNGRKGDPGYTPQKGVDYTDGAPGKPGEDYVLTEADKEEIAAMADATVPNAATVNDANELVMQRADGDVVKELFKTKLPVGGGSGIEVSGAAVGQTIKIAEVDENGVPTAWEAVEFPSGSAQSIVSYNKPLSVPFTSGAQYLMYAGGGTTFTLKIGTESISYKVSSSTDVVWVLVVQTAVSTVSLIKTDGSRSYVLTSPGETIGITCGAKNYVVIKIG